jgi:hypothetical protein
MMLPLDGVHILFDDAPEPPLESISNRKNALRHGSNPLPRQAPQDFFAAFDAASVSDAVFIFC